MAEIDPAGSYLMPAHFGPRQFDPRSSGWYRDVTSMTVSYLTDRERLAALLPEPFEVGEEPLVSVVYARNRDVDWLAGRGYNLIGVDAPVRYRHGDTDLGGTYSLVLWENLADAILHGRELHGIPKLFADIPDHDEADGSWRCEASHFGHRIVEMGITDQRAATDDEIATATREHEKNPYPMGWRYFPNQTGFGTAVSEAVTFPSVNEVSEAWVGTGSISWSHLDWEQNPTQFHIVNALADLPILEHRPAVVARGSTNLFHPDRPYATLGPIPPS